jgi:hypothetical protein
VQNVVEEIYARHVIMDSQVQLWTHFVLRVTHPVGIVAKEAFTIALHV